MKNRAQLIIDIACGLILIALLFVPVITQYAQLQARAGQHITATAAYHKGGTVARP